MENKELAFYIYPLPNGTPYTKEDLIDEEKVEELFDYCQILEGLILKSGWQFLIDYYGYEKLYQINQKSGWFDSENLKQFIQDLQGEIESSPR